MAGKKKISLAAEGEAVAASSPAAILAFLLARPLSLLRHVAHGCAGYLGGLASRLKPTADADACQTQQEEGNVVASAVVTEEVVVVQMRSRAMASHGPRVPREGRGGNGGPHH
ncbi:unnamed protein product [Urochloa decumbens]|uniref:Uncharacterized protein n=1 Tax=Urochloa decumbens TaxID=240449 RepID=A0ABC9GUR6_9POAL